MVSYHGSIFESPQQNPANALVRIEGGSHREPLSAGQHYAKAVLLGYTDAEIAQQEGITKAA